MIKIFYYHLNSYIIYTIIQLLSLHVDSLQQYKGNYKLNIIYQKMLIFISGSFSAIILNIDN